MLTRPWQANVILFVGILGFLWSIVSLVFNFYDLPAGAMGMTLVFMVPATLISLAIAWGLWVGKKWSTIVLLAFSCIGLLGSLMGFNLINLVLNAFYLWLGYQCYIDPFYNQNR